LLGIAPAEDCAVNILDRLFRILFARYRRKLGDSNLEAAWYRASNDLAMYIGSPILALEFAIFVILYIPLIKDSAFDSRQTVLIVGSAIFFACAYSLGRGFRKYLSDLPTLEAGESASDSRFISWFRAVSLGLFGLVCVSAFALHKAGFPAIP
jgi:membrane protease YdiL (CAAX protease family)